MAPNFRPPHPTNHVTSNHFALTREMENVCDTFESAWLSPERPVLADYLARVPTDCKPRLFGHLLELELSYRRDIGEAPRIEEYVQGFPECEEIARNVFENGCVDTSTSCQGSAGGRIGRYELIRRLGAGGQAEVFLARHQVLLHEVVVKLARHVCLNRDEEDRLINEGRILVRLEHPNLVKVHDLEFHQGHPFLVMQYEQGRSLPKVAEERPFTPNESAEIVRQVAEAVGVAHASDVVHLDIKPGNILLREEGTPCLIDFGLAQITRAADPRRSEGHSIVGTAAFMPPEQATGDWSSIGKKSDVFGLGAALHWLLAGHAPFEGSTFTQCMERAQRGSVDTARLDAVDVPGELKDICRRAMALDPNDRFSSVEALAAALRRYRDRRRRRRRAFLATGLFLALGMAITTAFSLVETEPRFNFEIESYHFIDTNLHAVKDAVLLEEYREEWIVGNAYYWMPRRANEWAEVVYRVPTGFPIQKASLIAGGEVFCAQQHGPAFDNAAMVLLDVSPNGTDWRNVVTYTKDNRSRYPEAGWDISDAVRGADVVYIRARLFCEKTYEETGQPIYAQFLRDFSGQKHPILAVRAD